MPLFFIHQRDGDVTSKSHRTQDTFHSGRIKKNQISYLVTAVMALLHAADVVKLFSSRLLDVAEVISRFRSNRIQKSIFIIGFLPDLEKISDFKVLMFFRTFRAIAC